MSCGWGFLMAIPMSPISATRIRRPPRSGGRTASALDRAAFITRRILHPMNSSVNPAARGVGRLRSWLLPAHRRDKLVLDVHGTIPGPARQDEDGTARDRDNLSCRIHNFAGHHRDRAASMNEASFRDQFAIGCKDRSEIVDLQIEGRKGGGRGNDGHRGDRDRCVRQQCQGPTVDHAEGIEKPSGDRHGNRHLPLRETDAANSHETKYRWRKAPVDEAAHQLNPGRRVPDLLPVDLALRRGQMGSWLPVSSDRRGLLAGERLRERGWNRAEDATRRGMGEKSPPAVLDKRLGQAGGARLVNQAAARDQDLAAYPGRSQEVDRELRGGDGGTRRRAGENRAAEWRIRDGRQRAGEEDAGSGLPPGTRGHRKRRLAQADIGGSETRQRANRRFG